MYYKPPKKQKFKVNYYSFAAILIITLALCFTLKSSLKSEEKESIIQVLDLPTEQAPPNTITPKETANIKKKRVENNNFVLKTKEGDNLSSLFEKAKLSNKILIQVLNDIKHAKYLKTLKPKQKFYFTTTKDNRLIKLIYQYSSFKQLLIKLNKDKTFSSVLVALKTTNERHYISATVEQSLYTTGLKQKIPHTLLVQLTRIFARNINFSKDVRNNDRFTIIYQIKTTKNQAPKVGKILAARYINKNTVHTAINYDTFNKEEDYFTPEGKSLKLNFDRYPIQYTHVSSHFDPHRMHPILKINRPHRGIDLAAKQGTKIHAVADGKISQIGQSSGYGNVIKIRHSSKYETVYAHMMRFKAGLTHGSHVKRGDVIGYVGQTGLATAPHCHFEFRVFSKHVDPATIALPTAPSIEKKKLLAFKKKTKALLDQLTLYESAQMASGNS